MIPLDSVKSWQLFLKTIFSGNKFTIEHTFPKHLETKGREMLTSCCGLPLAIKDVGRQLAEKRRLGSEWEDILEFRHCTSNQDMVRTNMAKAFTLWVIGKLERSMGSKWKDFLESWQCKSKEEMVTTNMAKALTLWRIQKLERSMGDIPDSWDGEVQGITIELRTILYFLGIKKLGNLRRLNYFISDIVDIVRKTLDAKDDNLSFHDKIFSLKREIEEVKKRTLKLRADEAELRLENVGVEEGDDDVVGLEKDVELLLRRAVFNEKQGLETSMVTGMAGIGKTTLARQVYNHADVVDRFERRAWVCVSTDLSYKELLMKLIQQVVNYEELKTDLLLNKMEYEDNQSLKQMLHQQLRGMRYIIVLDDWPKELCLKYILNRLPDEGTLLHLFTPLI